jgi:hypothetical protein
MAATSANDSVSEEPQLVAGARLLWESQLLTDRQCAGIAPATPPCPGRLGWALSGDSLRRYVHESVRTSLRSCCTDVLLLRYEILLRRRLRDDAGLLTA